MPSPTVQLGFAVLVAAAVLGEYYDRRALGVVVVVLLLPELDTLTGWVLAGAHRALLHNLLLVAAASGLLYYDTRVRDQSWLRERYGDWGVRVAVAALFAHVFAHVLLDYAHLEGVNLFYPVVDAFYHLEGELYLSTDEGLVQTFVEFVDPQASGQVVDAGRTGTTENVHVDSPVDPENEGPDGRPERRFPVAVYGWQLYLIAVGLFTAGAKRLQGDPPGDR
ncbi:hypothetical protein BRC81_02255 [Halobacteriales archaeon QS_1_68_20]|nr:MAG: hypothetical protein BRC81_02255 [Halobacteriales archaeon QS_1_68_20]